MAGFSGEFEESDVGMKGRKQLQKWLAIVLLFGSVIVLAGASWPLPSAQDVVPFPPTRVEIVVKPPLVEVETVTDAVLQEPRLIAIEWPEKIRLGDGDIVRLALEVDENGKGMSTIALEGQQATRTPVEIPDLYDTHNLVAEARLDLAGVAVVPQGTVQEPLRRGQVLNFYWSIQPQQIGRTRGTLWLFLNILPKRGGESERKALLAKQMELETVSVLGVSANLARWLGAIGAVLSVVLGFPFLEDALKGFLNKTASGKEEQLETGPE